VHVYFREAAGVASCPYVRCDALRLRAKPASATCASPVVRRPRGA